MTLFRSKLNGELYQIEHLIHDYKHLNRNSFAGFYANSYFGNAEPLMFILLDKTECEKFVNDNFKPVSYR